MTNTNTIIFTASKTYSYYYTSFTPISIIEDRNYNINVELTNIIGSDGINDNIDITDLYKQYVTTYNSPYLIPIIKFFIYGKPINTSTEYLTQSFDPHGFEVKVINNQIVGVCKESSKSTIYPYEEQHTVTGQLMGRRMTEVSDITINFEHRDTPYHQTDYFIYNNITYFITSVKGTCTLDIIP